MSSAQADLKKRLKKLMSLPENQVCSDCPERQPRWASLIVPPPGSPNGSLAIGAFCCLECSGSHRRLGVHISFVRSVNLDQWKEREVLAMENGGNKKVNAIFEAHLQTSGARKPLIGASGSERERYIRDKYERRKFYDPSVLHRYLTNNNNDDSDDDDDDDDDDDEEEEEEEEPATAARRPAPSEAAKRRAEQLRNRNRPLPTNTKIAPPGRDTKKILSSKQQQPSPPPQQQPPAPPPPPPEVDLLDFGTPVVPDPTSPPPPAVAPPPPPPAPAVPPVDLFGNMQLSNGQQANPNTNPTTNPNSIQQSINNNTIPLNNNNNNNTTTTTTVASNGLPSNVTPQKPQMKADEIMAMFHTPPGQASLQTFGTIPQAAAGMNHHPSSHMGMMMMQPNNNNTTTNPMAGLMMMGGSNNNGNGGPMMTGMGMQQQQVAMQMMMMQQQQVRQQPQAAMNNNNNITAMMMQQQGGMNMPMGVTPQQMQQQHFGMGAPMMGMPSSMIGTNTMGGSSGGMMMGGGMPMGGGMGMGQAQQQQPMSGGMGMNNNPIMGSMNHPNNNQQQQQQQISNMGNMLGNTSSSATSKNDAFSDLGQFH